MVSRLVSSICVVSCLGTLPAQAADISFCWVGANGYTMTGRMQVPDHKMSNAIVTETDVAGFKISGYQNGAHLGSWDMSRAGPNTTWHLRFDPVGMAFLTGDTFASTRSQGWNADGDVENCGAPGFGFNSGNYAQDICVNGQYIHDSSIDPQTPLLVSGQPFAADCSAGMLTSKSENSAHSD